MLAAWYDRNGSARDVLAVGALEPQFFAALKDGLGLTSSQFDDGLRDELTRLFLTQPRDHWCALLEGSDACFAPILSLADAPMHPHNVARGTFSNANGYTEPNPAPRFKDV